MTAEVVVLNKSAVALAADSTVTIGGNRKTYNTVNKVFTLSKHHPVGVMIYGNAELMGMPWETTIKEYRHHLEDRSFETLEEYATDFVGFIERSRVLFSEDLQRDFFRLWTQIYFRNIRKQITAEVESATSGGRKVTAVKVGEIMAARIANELESLEAKPMPPPSMKPSRLPWPNNTLVKLIRRLKRSSLSSRCWTLLTMSCVGLQLEFQLDCWVEFLGSSSLALGKASPFLQCLQLPANPSFLTNSYMSETVAARKSVLRTRGQSSHLHSEML